jgi:hypothetical protein
MQWEYYTTFLKAEAQYELQFLETLRDWKEGIPQFTPEALIPRLNAMGEDGWELVHMQPVVVGTKADVMITAAGTWTSTYFCVFKRAKSG